MNAPIQLAADRATIAAEIEALCAWAAAAPAVPDEVLAKTALVFVDDVAAAAAAHAEPEIVALVEKREAGSAATLLRPGAPRATRRDAALVNGVAGCWAELDEGYRGAPAHAALYILPALLAEAERRGATTRQALTLLAVAYEVVARLAETWRFPGGTIHPHAAMGGIGAAVGAALARGSDARVLRDAVTIAGGLVAAGTYQAAIEGSLVRNLWTGQGAVTGLDCADWAEAGFSGFPDGPHQAFTKLLQGTPDPRALRDGLGERWAILLCYHKLHGCCHSTHAAVEAVLDIRSRLRAHQTPDQIEAIRVRTHRPSMSNRRPHNGLAARFSFEHVVATAIVNGHAGPSAFTREAIADPDVARLRDLTRLEAFSPLPPWPQDRPAHVTVDFLDGARISSTCMSAPGGPDRPLSAREIVAKAEAVAGTACPSFAGMARQIVAMDDAVLDQPLERTLADLLAV